MGAPSSNTGLCGTGRVAGSGPDFVGNVGIRTGRVANQRNFDCRHAGIDCDSLFDCSRPKLAGPKAKTASSKRAGALARFAGNLAADVAQLWMYAGVTAALGMVDSARGMLR